LEFESYRDVEDIQSASAEKDGVFLGKLHGNIESRWRHSHFQPLTGCALPRKSVEDDPCLLGRNAAAEDVLRHGARPLCAMQGS
jgi:hypothetical protein